MRFNNIASFSRRAWLATCVALGLLATACTDPYQPDIIKQPASYLVVDGFINTQGITTIKLSRTFPIGGSTVPPVESRASAYMEEEGGPRYLLQELPAGTYSSTALVLNPAKNYRLHLTTQAGKEYASDYVPAKVTPPVDDVNWRIDNTGLNISVNAHDATATTRYYRWEYDETWEIRPSFTSSFEYVNHAMRFRTVPLPSVCWGTAHSTGVQTYQTTALSQDVVNEFPLRKMATSSERLSARYSILVQQYALTKAEYEYWELLRKNTESIGTLFDPQPSQLTGNVHGLSSASDIALGYVGAHSLAEKRLFISRADLPPSLPILTGYEKCVPPDTVDLYPKIFKPPTPAAIMEIAFNGPNYLPVYDIRDPTGLVIAYLASSRDCVDCRTRGASVKPSYWP